VCPGPPLAASLLAWPASFELPFDRAGHDRWRCPANALTLHFFVFTVAGWINRVRQDIIE